jgi:predicted DsbA family dithiol-disulfide isomerase
VTTGTPAVRITYVTDPLCSWSWAFEPVRDRLRAQYGDAIGWTYRMCGLIPDWGSFADPVNGVRVPAQLAPAWYYVGSVTGIPIDARIWHEDPPASSYPACIAAKAAACQGEGAEERYLRAVRAAAMTRRLNTSRTEVLLELAGELEAAGAFDAERFRTDLVATAARSAFADDLRFVRLHEIGRYPAFIVCGSAGSRLVVGYRPYDMFEKVLLAVGLRSPTPVAAARDE